MSTTVNVFRYTGLVGGIFYGIMHRRSLQKEHDHHKEESAVHRREELINQAKEAWTAKQQAGKGDGVVTNPEDPNFDLEKLIAKWETDSK